VKHLERQPEGLTLRIAHSKPDQEAGGQIAAIHRASGAVLPCASRVGWQVAAETGGGALFRTDASQRSPENFAID
jgi:hypothetical protein